jgi:antitoxin CptB
VSSVSDDRSRDRIFWHCRRGLLELDLLLQRFVARHLDALDDGQTAVFVELLEYDDNDLFDMVMKRAEPVNERLSPVLALLRDV